ncbi:hypothetical protein AnigIFM56816_000983 [Aspergillus niger]|nr:hypothetical protein AnigIFM56816_000983 [Aspergillus niger]
MGFLNCFRRTKPKGERTSDAESNSDRSESSPQSSDEDTSFKNVEKLIPADDTSKIVYVARYLQLDSDGDYVLHTTKRLKQKLELTKAPEAHTVLEEHREVYPSARHGSQKKHGIVDTIGNPILYIHSPILLDALRANIDCQSIPNESRPMDYRAKSITSDLGKGHFVYPFFDLYHYREKLLRYRELVKESHDHKYCKTCGEHIDVLNGYLEALTDVGVKDAERLASDPVPKTTFASLWLLLKPGSDVYVREEGKLNAYVIESFSGGMSWDSNLNGPLPYRVHVWNLNFDGQYLTRSVKAVSIPVFDHDREINTLPVFPVQFHIDEDLQNPLHQQLVDRGKRFVEIVKKPTFQEYSGASKLQGIRTFNRARVVIDHQSQPWNLDVSEDEENPHQPVKSIYGVDLGERTRVARCTCKTCKGKDPQRNNVDRRAFDDYDNIDLSSTETLTDHHYFLCSSHVHGFVLKDRAWDVLEVSGLRDPKIDKDIIDSLVMKPESNKEMIKAVCETYGGAYTDAFSSDFVQGKGEGQILLLHGPPGTGKTLTAESVAEYTGRPLLSITAADLGHEPVLVEQNLVRFFRNARKWNAIVLLDEADVYLEARSTQDLQRNSIVSIFLRALDYFQGILFLTTNRVGSFDEAFMSRIHVQIGYDPLSHESREKIWDGFFKKLSRNHEEGGQRIRCSYDAKEYVRRDEDLKLLEWNGREIRNDQAFQTAVALACFQAKTEGNRIPELTDEHLRQVVDMSHNFKSYLRTFRGPEEEMAWAARIRNDATKASGGRLQGQASSI